MQKQVRFSLPGMSRNLVTACLCAITFYTIAPSNQASAPSENRLGTDRHRSLQQGNDEVHLHLYTWYLCANIPIDISLDLAMGVAPMGTRGSQGTISSRSGYGLSLTHLADKVVNLAAAYGG